MQGVERVLGLDSDRRVLDLKVWGIRSAVVLASQKYNTDDCKLLL